MQVDQVLALSMCSLSLSLSLSNLHSHVTLAGRVVAPSIWILLERLRDGILAGKCEMLDDCFVESS